MKKKIDCGFGKSHWLKRVIRSHKLAPATAMFQIVNARGRVVNGVWNGKTPMRRDEALRKIFLMTVQGRGIYRLRRVR